MARCSSDADAQRHIDAAGSLGLALELAVEHFGTGKVAVRECVHRDAGHFFAARSHLLETLDEARRGLDFGHELRQFGDRHAVVRHALEVKVDVEHREHKP